MAEETLRAEVERRLDRPFADVQSQLTELLDLSWEEVEVVVETSADAKERSHADVIVDLVDRSERKPKVHEVVRRAAIRFIGRRWHQRENPWDRHKHRVPPTPPRTDAEPEDLDEWTPYRPDEDGRSRPEED